MGKVYFRKWYSFYFGNIYQFYYSLAGRWGSETKAIVTLVAMEIGLIVAFTFYLLARSDVTILPNIGKAWVAFPLAIIFYITNHFLLFRNDRWKIDYELFLKLPKKEKTLLRSIFLIFTLFVPLIYACLLYRIGDLRGI